MLKATFGFHVVPSFDNCICVGLPPLVFAIVSVTIVVLVYVAPPAITTDPSGPPLPARGFSVVTLQFRELFVAEPPPLSTTVFTIEYVGGWAQVEKKFFDPRTGIMAKIQAQSGG